MGTDFNVVYLWIDAEQEPEWNAGLAAAATWRPTLASLGSTLEAMSVEEARKTLVKDIAEIRLVWDDQHPEGALLEIADKKVLVTGGLSHGGPPNALYETMFRIIDSGLYRDLGFEA
jgi:hypothetical protein